MRNIGYLLITSMILAFGSCRKIQHLPPEPYIEFRSFAVFDTTDILGNRAKGGRLNFYFQDGDGDMGLYPVDYIMSDTTNIFFTLYRKTSGVMTPAPLNDPLRPSSYRIPYMEQNGQNKILKGTISVTFLYLFYSQEDTIRYDFYIKDRANNESNLVSTSEIVLTVNGIYSK
jgi:hypothetical protein